MKGISKFCSLYAMLACVLLLSMPSRALAQNAKDESGISGSSFADQICGMWISDAYGDVFCGCGNAAHGLSSYIVILKDGNSFKVIRKDAGYRGSNKYMLRYQDCRNLGIEMKEAFDDSSHDWPKYPKYYGQDGLAVEESSQSLYAVYVDDDILKIDPGFVDFLINDRDKRREAIDKNSVILGNIIQRLKERNVRSYGSLMNAIWPDSYSLYWSTWDIKLTSPDILTVNVDRYSLTGKSNSDEIKDESSSRHLTYYKWKDPDIYFYWKESWYKEVRTLYQVTKEYQKELERRYKEAEKAWKEDRKAAKKAGQKLPDEKFSNVFNCEMFNKLRNAALAR